MWAWYLPDFLIFQNVSRNVDYNAKNANFKILANNKKSNLTTSVKCKQNKTSEGIQPIGYLFDPSALNPLLGELKKPLKIHYENFQM